MRTDNYAITEEYSWAMGSRDAYVLPQGAFVSPISLCYLPKYFLENVIFKHVDTSLYTFCYTRYGILPIPNRIISVR